MLKTKLISVLVGTSLFTIGFGVSAQTVNNPIKENTAPINSAATSQKSTITPSKKIHLLHGRSVTKTRPAGTREHFIILKILEKNNHDHEKEAAAYFKNNNNNH